MPYNEKSKENLQPNIKSREQAQNMGRKGGIASQASQRAKKREREEWQEILSLAIDNGIAEDIESLKDAKAKNLTVSKAMKVKLVTEALKGNIKAYEAIMRFAGADEQEISQEVTVTKDTTFIDALNATAKDVWSNETEET